MADESAIPSLPDQIVNAMLAQLEVREEFDAPTIKALRDLANSTELDDADRIMAVLAGEENDEQ